MSNLGNGGVILKFNNSVLVQKSSCSLYSYFKFIHSIVKLVRNAIKSKFSHNGPITAFDGEGSWSFDYGFARNVVIFGVNHISSSYSNNRKNNCLVLGKGPADGINDSTGAAGKKLLVLTIVKQIHNFAYVYITMVMKVTFM